MRSSGKRLVVGGSPFVAKGVTYGSFLPRADRQPFPPPAVVGRDLAAMARLGLNTVRTYALPPPELLQAAADLGMRVLVGLDYPDWRMHPTPGRAAHRRVRAAGVAAVQQALGRCAGRPEVLGISVGNEVPADLIRVHGIGAVEDTLSALVEEVHAGDPEMLTTYTSFPTTEYLQVEGIDLVTFNVFLEEADGFDRYLRHLQTVAGPRPLLITELGLAGDVHGEGRQAELLEAQLRSVDEAGCAGATVFAWTDEWGVAGQPVSGWGFGICDEQRVPKPSAGSVSLWARRTLADTRSSWPSVTVVVCAYNEERTIGTCLASLADCRYPDLEVVVCDDGSTDRTLEVARGFPFRILQLDHGGLSRARNAGIEAASGEIVAFLDADAACDPEWPFHLALSLEHPRRAATGGPNLPFPHAGLVERAVALAPGSPTEVLIGDDRAEHVAGCNMAFRAERLREIAGFDAVYTTAGDDVDVCWKLLDAGHEIGFSAAAQVFHRRRSTVRGYLRQQRGYGRAEKLLSGAHPHRFNGLGQARWSGVIYGGVGLLPRWLRPVVYHGAQGRAPFQPISRQPASSAVLHGTVLVPLAVPALLLGGLAAALSPWFLLLPALVTVLLAAFSAAVAVSVHVPHDEPQPSRLRALVAFLHLAQPLARTWGRLQARPHRPPRSRPVWTGDRAAWVRSLERELRAGGCAVRVGGEHDHWDLEVSVGPLLRGRITTGVAWSWVLHLRTRQRLTPIAVLLLPATALLALVTPGTAVATAVLATSRLAAEHRRLRDALALSRPGG